MFHQKQVAHWVQSVILSMKLAVFVDTHIIFGAVVHKKGCFCGREGVFKVGIQENGRFSGWEGGRRKRDTLERMSL